jgi:hypothetical protein
MMNHYNYLSDKCYASLTELTIDASERLSGFFIIMPSVRIIASFPDIISKRTTPNA